MIDNRCLGDLHPPVVSLSVFIVLTSHRTAAIRSISAILSSRDVNERDNSYHSSRQMLASVFIAGLALLHTVTRAQVVSSPVEKSESSNTATTTSVLSTQDQELHQLFARQSAAETCSNVAVMLPTYSRLCQPAPTRASVCTNNALGLGQTTYELGKALIDPNPLVT